MNCRIVYLMSGPAHLPYLTCSLWTLRQQTRLPVYVYAWPQSFNIVKRMAKDERLGFNPVLREPEYQGKNSQFIDKIRLVMGLEGTVDAVMYLDADTTVHGDPSPILDAVKTVGFVGTQFCNWMATKRTVRRRIERLLQFPRIDQCLVRQTLESSWPSVNGGVWAAKPESPVLPLWNEWTMEARSIFIADETVLHVLQTMFTPDHFTTLCGGRWNCSPKFQPPDVSDNKVVIRHFHGDSNVRPTKTQRGVDLWWPIYQRCLEENAGGIQEWSDRVENKFLDPLRESLCCK